MFFMLLRTISVTGSSVVHSLIGLRAVVWLWNLCGMQCSSRPSVSSTTCTVFPPNASTYPSRIDAHFVKQLDQPFSGDGVAAFGVGNGGLPDAQKRCQFYLCHATRGFKDAPVL